MRLAFGLATSVNSEILLLDEVIGTGDQTFQQKAQQRLNGFLNKAEIVVISSHDISAIKKFCNKAILLEHGRLIKIGAVDKVLEHYQPI